MSGRYYYEEADRLPSEEVLKQLTQLHEKRCAAEGEVKRPRPDTPQFTGNRKSRRAQKAAWRRNKRKGTDQ